jgi:hypothetical protein
MGLGRELPPDLPLRFEGLPKVSLGLYNSVPAALITEFGLFIAGIAIYLSTTRAKDRVGRWASWLLILVVALRAILSVMNCSSGGPQRRDGLLDKMAGAESQSLSSPRKL